VVEPPLAVIRRSDEAALARFGDPRLRGRQRHL